MSNSFSLFGHPQTSYRPFRSMKTRAFRMVADDKDNTIKKGQEMRMEMASLAGAKAISKLSLNERTKRAMIAEAVEDRIYELTDEIEQIVVKNDGELVGDDKEEAVELAKQTKALQAQYDDLVNGRPSYLLDVEENKDVFNEEEGFQ